LLIVYFSGAYVKAAIIEGVNRAVHLPLIRLSEADRFELPGWPGLELLRLTVPRERTGADRHLYVLLEGELLVDLPEGRYLHLRPGEGAEVEGAHVLTPIVEAVALEWKPSR